MKKLLLLLPLLFYNFASSQSIISVTPNNGNRGQQDLNVTITTQDIDFSVSTPTVDVSFIDQFSNILPVDWNSFYLANQLVVHFSIPGYAIPGPYSVNVAEVGGAFNMTMANGFTVNNQYTYSINGNVRYDSNGNGCDATDISMPYQKINFTNGSGSGTISANNAGFYNYYDVQIGNNSFSPVLENPSYFTVSPPSASVNVSPANNLIVQDFCISPNGTHNDLEVSLVPYGPARPGFDASYKIIYKNKGTHAQSGTLNLSFFDDNIMDFVTAVPAINSQGTNSLSWNFTNLLPFEKREILVTMNINSPVETPAVTVGNDLIYTATVVGATDETPDNNTSILHQTVVGSYDPNDKTCAEGRSLPISEVGKYLHYVIRFENTGTANAENIVIKDVIDTSKFDISSLIPLSGSHAFTTKIKNNLVQFIFENINLPFDDANNDGYVAFKIKTKPTVTVGSNINNTANIYFDYNAPITTNTSTVNVYNPLHTSEFDFNNLFALSPVPAKESLLITNKQQVAISSLNIYNTLGQLVLSSVNPSEIIDVSGLGTGTYFIKIISDKGTASSKFVKE